MTEMRYYVMVFLRTGPMQPTDAEEKKALQMAHFGNMERYSAKGIGIFPSTDSNEPEGAN